MYYLENGLSQAEESLLEGKNLKMSDDQILELDNKKHTLSDESVLNWSGKNTNGSHKGTSAFKSGFINISNDLMEGEFVIDMNSVTTTDLTQEQGKDYLDQHLKSEYFLFTKLLPEAKFFFKNNL